MSIPTRIFGERSGFLGEYFRHVSAEELSGRTDSDLEAAAFGHKHLGDVRSSSTACVRVYTPTVSTHGWAVGRSVLDIVTDDMPFLVDSVTNVLTRRGLTVYLVIHPHFDVVRDPVGHLVEIRLGVGDDPADLEQPDRIATGQQVTESWIHIEFDAVEADGEAIEREVHSVLLDVRKAVSDWSEMRQRAVDLARELRANPPVGVAGVDEGAELLQWLADDNFTFLGYREYDLVGEGSDEALRTVAGSGRGILRSEKEISSSFALMTPEARVRAREPKLLVLTKANSRSTVHRSVYLDYIAVKRFDADGLVNGERRFLGLFAASAYTQSVREIPVLRQTADRVFEMSDCAEDSHSGRDLIAFLETYPRDELFQVTAQELFEVSEVVLHMQERRQTRLFARPDVYGRFMSCLVYLPRDRYTTSVRLEIEGILRRAFDGVTVDYTARVTESVLARLHFIIRVAPGTQVPDVDVQEVQERLVQASRSWQDDFHDSLSRDAEPILVASLAKEYSQAFPEAYKEDFPARTGVADAVILHSLSGDIAVNLYEPVDDHEANLRFKVYRAGHSLSLSEVLPILQRFGFDVIDERPYDIETASGAHQHIYDFGLKIGGTIDRASLKERFEEAFHATWEGRCESDSFNALVLEGGMRWREVVVMRALSRYLRQIGTPFGQDYIEKVLVLHQEISSLLLTLFLARHDPTLGEQRVVECADVERRIASALDDVESLDHDRILRSILSIVSASTRTNYFQTESGEPKPWLSVKFDPQLIDELPLPRPRFEVWVYSPRVEGVHLRFGSVARGGLRWSDRKEDFRTEVLGLVKAQEVKNAVIVPVGAKGGFFAKKLPDPTRERDAWLAEGIAAYQQFISGLLDITDNRVGADVIPPIDVVRHDGDDPYLVVAADKGTATFSDIANGLAIEYGFWLGDAFASGGSVGYDHKAMGITARGAWESVKRHFRELGIDTQTTPFTVLGIGDMSGDVFGNGMLLSRHIMLLGAFDHRHIFLDPNPDPSRSFDERQRLFNLPRSSWADYSPDLISEGGGVWPRTAKSIPLSSQVRAVLGIDESISHLSPAELMRALLCAPVGLMWNGGIGTYVKSSDERDADVGDRANDAIRVNGSDLRCQVVGEGGNLGFTQLGRIEAAFAGVRLNTDAIDNSAGVDTSDHEVNIKILLDRAVRNGDLTMKQRNELLASMTDEIAAHVLVDNYGQNVALGNARAGARALISVHQRLISSLEAKGLFSRSLEKLPSDSDMHARAAIGRGLTSPELSVLMAWTKIDLTSSLTQSSICDDPAFANVVPNYFPAEIRDRTGVIIAEHPLRKEIAATSICNHLVNRAGITFVFRAGEETGATPVEVVRAAYAAIDVFDLEDFWESIDALDNVVSTDLQTALHLESRRLLDRATRWFLTTRGGEIDSAAESKRYASTLRDLRSSVPQALRGEEHDRWLNRTNDFISQGCPVGMAENAAAMLDAFSLLDICEVSERTGIDSRVVLDRYFALSERFGVDQILGRITRLPRGDRWSALARQALRSDLYGVLSGLTQNALRSTPDIVSTTEWLETWEALHSAGVDRTKQTLEEISLTASEGDLATLSVALRVLRNLLTQSGATAARSS